MKNFNIKLKLGRLKFDVKNDFNFDYRTKFNLKKGLTCPKDKNIKNIRNSLKGKIDINYKKN